MKVHGPGSHCWSLPLQIFLFSAHQIGCWGLSQTTSWNTSCPQYVTVNGNQWPSRFYPDCMIRPIPNAANTGAVDLYVLAFSTYKTPQSGAMSKVELLLQAVAQEVEDTLYLPGYRLNFRLVDNLCAIQDSVVQLFKEATTPPAKHALLSGTCSECCMAENDAVQLFNLIQLTATCMGSELSDRTRYPYLLRMPPDAHFIAVVTFGLLEMLKWKRFALVHDEYPISTSEYAWALQKMSSDSTWMMVLDIPLPATDAPSAIALKTSAIASSLKKYDARIVLLFVFYNDVQSVLFCEAAAIGWASDAGVVYFGTRNSQPNLGNLPVVNGFLQAAGRPTCAREVLLRATYGMILINRPPMQTTPLVHGLSNRTLANITALYNTQCATFANGTGLCSDAAGYFYDVGWELAWLFREFLITAQWPLSDLVTASGREWLFQKGLTASFQGVTGWVRHYNFVSPTATPPSIGDREGTQTIFQLRGTAVPIIGQWAAAGGGTFSFVGDLWWSPDNTTQRTRCSRTTCDPSKSWAPAYYNSSCPPGMVYSFTSACNSCPAGTAPDSNVSCGSCPAGTFAAAGQDSCQACERGTFQSLSGKSFCSPCPPGSLSEPGAIQCQPCPQGTFREFTNTTGCYLCPAGTTTQFPGTESAAGCGCAQGSYWKADKSSCIPCTAGMDCSGFNLFGPSQQAGYWVQSIPPFRVWRCLNPKVCPAGSAGSCAANRQARPGCTHCDYGFNEQGGVCEPCKFAASAGFAFGALLAVCLALVLFHVSSNFSMSQTSAEGFIGSSLAAMAMTAVLMIRAFGSVQLQAQFPVKAFFDGLQILILRLDVLALPCLMGTSELWSKYMLELLVLPIAVLMLGLILLCAGIFKRFRKALRVSWPKFLNSCGGLMSTFFISMSVLAVNPFNCQTQPTGQVSLLRDLAVECWTPAHRRLIVMACIALLVYPITFMSITIFVTWKKLTLLRRYGHSFVLATRFFFGRFKPDKGSSFVFLAMRHLLVALLPVIAQGAPSVQHLLLLILVLSWLAFAVWSQPWRFLTLNVADFLSSLCYVIILFQLQMLQLAPVDSTIMGWTVVVECCLLMAILVLSGLGWLLITKLRGKPFKYFLSHHKEAAGLFCRQLKLQLQSHTRDTVFLDVDNLTDLDQLEFVVRTRTEILVVVLTTQVLHRLWCAVEIVTAWKNKVQIQLLVAERQMAAELASSAFVQQALGLWTEAQWDDFAQLGISRDDVEGALEHLKQCPICVVPIDGNCDEQEQGILQLVENTTGTKLDSQIEAWTQRWTETPNSHRRPTSADEGLHRVIIACDPQDPTQHCGGSILRELLSAMGVCCLLPESVDDLRDRLAAELQKSELVCIVLLSESIRKSPVAIALLTAIVIAHRPVIPVVQGAYSKPEESWFQDIVDGKEEFMVSMSLPWIQEFHPEASLENIESAMLYLYSMLAMPFTASGSEEVMMAGLDRIVAKAERAAISRVCSWTGSLGSISFAQQQSEPQPTVVRRGTDQRVIIGI